MQSGSKLLHYTIFEKIGHGGMGEVYRAEDTRLGRQVAIKFLPPAVAEDQKANRRLLQEARAASALNHPNIVTIYSIEESEGTYFLVMEYLEGETLKSLIDSGSLASSDLIEIASQVSEGLAAAHAAGLIHRDIKPSNVFVTRSGQAKILDFGLAKILQASGDRASIEKTMSKLTQTGMIVGTVAYMSPEQTRGEPLDSRSDIFSLGCVLYEAATGKPPFNGPSVLSILHEIATIDPPAPSSIARQLPQGLDRIIKRSLSKDKNLRYSSAEELAEALRELRFASRYQIIREIGRGGMGVVYLARDPLLERDVAIKVISPEALSSEAVERFKREARLVAKMDHPAIVGIHDFGEHDGSLFFVMPFVQGTSLRNFIKDGSLSLGDVIDIGIQVADALDYSHAQGVVHRDVKPENILVTRRDSPTGEIRLRVTDFGLAMTSAEGRLTKTGALVGTISYLSPEQVAARELDSRSDIYSLGTILYECLVGTLPFSGEIQSVLYRIAHEIPQPPRALGSEVREELETIVMQCLEKDPAKRPQRASEVVDALSKHRAKLQESDRAQKISVIHRASTVMQRPVLSPFVGREKEFAELQRRLNAAIQSECQFAVVAGEAGIGKTRLLEELENLAKARNIRVLHGRFVELDRAFPYQGFCDFIQEYFRSVRTTSTPTDFSDLAPDLVSLFPVLTELQDFRSPSPASARIVAPAETRKFEDRTYIYELLARSLSRLAAGKPLVLLLEDLHSADVSIDALQYIVRRLGPTPTFFVATYRTTEVAKRHPILKMLDSFHDDRRFVSMRLDPFLLSELRAFLQTLVGGNDVEARFVEKLYEATEGNPYFTKELVRSLLDSGRITQNDTGEWSLSGETAIAWEALPATIQQTIEKRIERLPEQARDVLSVASLIGKTFEFRDLEALADESLDVDEALERLLQDGFIQEERVGLVDQFSFSSAVVRDVLYAALSRRKRKILHRKYAEHLEKIHGNQLERVYSQLVHHYSNGDMPAKAIEYGLKAAERSLDAFSAEDAIRSAKLVLGFLQNTSGSDRLLEAQAGSVLARASRLMGNFDEAVEYWKRVVSILEKEKASTVEAMLSAAETAWEGRKVEDARLWVEKGLNAGRAAGETEKLWRLLSLGATLANLRGEYAKAKEFLLEAEKLQPAKKEQDAEIPKGGRLRVAFPIAIVAKHPVEIQLVEEAEIFPNIFETLITTDARGNLVPCLAEKWSAQDQGKSFVFELRPGITMHDGRKVTAQEVKKCLEESVRRSADFLPAAFAIIAGVTDFIQGTTNTVEGITAPGENNLEIRLSEALPIYPALLSDPRSAVATNDPLAGSGPFKLQTLEANRIMIERNENYAADKPALLDGIEFRTGLSAAEIAAGFRSGNFDVVSELLPEDLEDILRERTLRASFVETPKKNTCFVLFNKNGPIGQNAAVRQALCGVIRTQDVVRGTLGRFAQPAEGLLPPGVFGHDPGRRRYPIPFEKARDLLQSAEVSTPLRLKAAVHPVLQDRHLSLTKAILKVWSNLGVDVTIATPNMASYIESQDKNEDIDLMIGKWTGDYDDPDNFTYGLFDSRIGIYHHYYSSPEMDRLVEEARLESRPAAREKLYHKIENLLIDSAYFLPLFHDIDYRIANPHVLGLTLKSSPPFVNYSQIGKSESTTAPSRRTGGGTLHIPVAGTVDDLDPSLTSVIAQQEVMTEIFDTLTREGEGSRIVPWLASDFHIEEGGRKFRFHLRDDVRFHDGRRLTARDIRYSYERLLRNRESPSRNLLSPIKGAKELLNSTATELSGFQIQSPLDFTIELDQPVSFFPALLTYNAAAIVPEGTDRFSGNWRNGCLGTGPFRVIRFDPGNQIELEPNPFYWQEGYPKADGLIFTLNVGPEDTVAGFRAGRFSITSWILPSDIEALRHEKEYSFRYAPRMSSNNVSFNTRSGPFADEELRRKVTEALDVERIITKQLGRIAVPSSGIIPPGLLGYEPRRSSVSKGGRQKIVDHLPIRVVKSVAFQSSFRSVGDEIVTALEEMGFEVSITSLTDEARKSMQGDLILQGWIADYPDTDTFVYGLLHTKGGYLGPWCGTPEIDRLAERGRTETNPDARHEIYREVEEIIKRRALLIPMFYEVTYRFARPEVEGFELTFSMLNPVPYEKLWIRR